MAAGEQALNRRSYSVEELESYARRFRTWGRWGPDDERGMANLVTPERIAAAAGLARRGVVHSLAIPMDRHGPQPAHATRSNPQHLMIRVAKDALGPAAGKVTTSDDALYTPLQAATHWDGFAHFFYDGVTYNGRTVDVVTAVDGADAGSVTSLLTHAVGRGVLLDVARFLGRPYLAPGEAIQADQLADCARAQGVEVRSGDICLIRTGHLERRRAEGAWGDFAGGPAPGLGVSASEFLVPREVVAVAVDTWAGEVMPFEAPMICPLHVCLIVEAGVHIGEMWDLASLAADCARYGTYEFWLSAPPLPVTGAVGSPVSPLAVL